jgi:hypothetical protein
MLEKTFSLLFYLKKPKNYLRGPMSIYLQFHIENNKTQQRKKDPQKFSQKKEISSKIKTVL